MKDKKDWLLLFVRKFREILDIKEYREYREFFPAFCNYTYLSIELQEFFDKQGNHTKNILYLFSSEYGDQVEIVQRKDSFWMDFFNIFINSLNDFTEYLEKTKDIGMKNILTFQNFNNNKLNSSIHFSLQDLRNFIKTLIDKEILTKLKILTHNHLYQKALNRISLLKFEEINEIIEFLDSDWSETKDSIKCEKFARIFYTLGFEVIPIENLLSHRNFKDLNHLSHPELIIYDLNSNYILLFEELTIFKREYLYKKDTVQNIVARFNNYFYMENRKIDYLIIAGKEISIDLNHYNYQYRAILKDSFIKMFHKVFNEELTQIDILENFQIRIKIIELIESLKKLNFSDNKNKTQ